MKSARSVYVGALAAIALASTATFTTTATAEESTTSDTGRAGAYAALTVLEGQRLFNDERPGEQGRVNKFEAAARRAASETQRSGASADTRNSADHVAQAAGSLLRASGSQTPAQISEEAQRITAGARELVSSLIKGDNYSRQSVDISKAPELRDALTDDSSLGVVSLCTVLATSCLEDGHAADEHGSPSGLSSGSGKTTADLLPLGSGTLKPTCDTSTNTSRTRVVYAWFSSPGNRLSTYRSTIETMAREAEDNIARSASKQGGTRRIRYVTDSSCNLAITSTQLTSTAYPSSAAGYQAMADQLAAAGSNNSKGKYMVFLDNPNDGGGNCGQAYTYDDARKDPAVNYANGNAYVSYAAVYKGCWDYTDILGNNNGMGGGVAFHEMGHALGAVQKTAPYATSGGHCYDGRDGMCYNDGSTNAGLYSDNYCPNSTDNRLWDCNNNTYFARIPATGSWLANNWNLYSSYFLKAT